MAVSRSLKDIASPSPIASGPSLANRSREYEFTNSTTSFADRPSINLESDVDLRALAEDIQKSAKELTKLKADIVRKMKKENSKQLSDCEKRYESTIDDLTNATKRILMSISPGDRNLLKDGNERLQRQTLEIKEHMNRGKELRSLKKQIRKVSIGKAMAKQFSDQRFSELQIQVDSLKRQVSKESSLKDDARKSVWGLRTQVDSLQDQVSEESALKDDAIKRVSELQIKVDSLQGQVSEESAFKDDAEKKVSKRHFGSLSQDVIDESALNEIMRVSELQIQVDSMQGQVSKESALKNDAKRRVSELQVQVDSLQDQVSEESALKDDAKRRVSELEIQVDSLQDQVSEESALKDDARNRVLELERMVNSLQEQVREQSALEYDSTNRMSELASSRLRDNNLDFTDVSDTNRPTRLAEKVSEMYDNEWKEAFDEIKIVTEHTERELIEYLLKALMDIFTECQRITTHGYFERVQACIEHTDMVPHTQANVEIPDELRELIKEFRKSRAEGNLENIANGLLQRFAYLQKPPYNSEKAREYVKKCVEISWLMCVQNPPLLLSTNSREKFNSALYREYTRRGRYIAYVVWPIVYLNDEDGPILCKGVAQGFSNEIELRKMPERSPYDYRSTRQQVSMVPNFRQERTFQHSSSDLQQQEESVSPYSYRVQGARLRTASV